MNKIKADKNCSQTPKNIKVNTQITPEDLEPVVQSKNGDTVSDNEVEDAVTVINPDPNSMESRG